MRAYLGEFLSDPRVVKLPRFIWLPILKGIVLRTRPEKSAEKYAAIWTPEGSPLAVNTKRLAQALRAHLGGQVEYAMRYGEPSIDAVLARFPDRDVKVIPLYPQYAESTTETIADVLAGRGRMVKDFHDHPGYIRALAAGVRRHWERHGRASLVMSFHGLPRRGAEVYATQCRATAALLAEELGLEDGEWQVTFQSRFGFAEWLQPYTEPTLVAMARAGVARVDVVCPGFVCDCLETLEEIGITARKAFVEAGGKQMLLIPCLNDSAEWVAALAEITS